MSKRRFVPGLLSLAVAVLLAPVGQAVVLPEAGFDELVVRADSIYLGKVVDKRAAWNKDRTLIFTHYTFEIERPMKGVVGGQVTVTEIGGQVGELAVVVDGTPGYEIGEEAVVFLHREKGRSMTLHWFQGKFPIVKDWAGKRSVVLPRQEPVSVDEFHQRVQRVLTRAVGGQP